MTVRTTSHSLAVQYGVDSVTISALATVHRSDSAYGVPDLRCLYHVSMGEFVRDPVGCLAQALEVVLQPLTSDTGPGGLHSGQ